MKVEFSLQHTVLYAKGWYKRSKDIWADLRKVLNADDYSADIMKNGELAMLLLHRLEALKNPNVKSVATVISAIEPHNCWTYGYFCQGSPTLLSRKDEVWPEYDRSEAIVRYCLSIFGNLKFDEWNPCKPDFKVLPRKNGVTDASLKEHFSEERLAQSK